MRKKDKLYTVNRFNRPFFQNSERLYKEGGELWESLATADQKANPWDYADDVDYTQQYKQQKNAFGISKENNPFSKGNIGSTLKAFTSPAMSTIGGLLTNGYTSKAGSMLNAASSIAGMVPGGQALSLGLQGASILSNALLGEKVDQEKLNRANEDISALSNVKGDAKSNDALKSITVAHNAAGTYQGGPLSGAKKKQKALENKILQAGQFADRTLANNAGNIGANQISDSLATYGALGGPLEMLPSSIGGAAMDYLTMKKQQNQNKNQMTNVFTGTPQRLFVLGGDTQTHGADWSTGLVHIDAGKSHEENPNNGVRFGMDNKGVPNLLEEGETVFDDYVFSKRIYADGGTLKKFHLPKKAQLTYADISKRLEKEIKERENDPISQAGFRANMYSLMEEQERQKKEMEAQRAQEAFAALSPEEQTALMQQRAAQEQAAQQQAMMQKQMAEQEAMQQQGISPEEIAIAQQQEYNLGQEPQMAAEGGKLFGKGGVIKFLNTLGYKTVKEAEEAGWSPSDFGDYKNWSDINSNSQLADDFQWREAYADRVKSPAMKAALSLGWNPTAPLIGRKWYEGDNGNSVGWTQSYGKDRLDAKEFKEYANRYKNTLGWAVDKGIIKAPEGNSTVSMAEVAKAMSQAPDWINTDKWLYSDIANQEAYLGMARDLNPDDDTKFVSKWSPYGTFTKGDDDKWNFTLNSNLTDAQKQAFTDQFRKARTDNRIGVMYNNFTDPTTVTNRYVLDDKGNPVLLTTDNLSDYEQLGSYSWGNDVDNVNNNAIIYQLKDAAAAKTDKEKEEEFKKKVAPKYQNSLFGIEDAGPLLALGMQAMNIGRPNTSGLEAAANVAGNYTTADWMPRGDFMKLKLTDPWRYTIPILANSKGTDRAILNSGASQGAKMAGLLANGYNTTTSLGEAGLKGDDVNWQRYVTQKTHDAEVHRSNQGEYGQTSRFNASAYNDANRASANAKMQASAQRLEADMDWNGSKYRNINNLFQNMGLRRKENRTHNMIAGMAANGLFGVLTPDNPIAKDYLQWVGAEGGKVKRKKNSKRRGLTF